MRSLSPRMETGPRGSTVIAIDFDCGERLEEIDDLGADVAEIEILETVLSRLRSPPRTPAVSRRW